MISVIGLGFVGLTTALSFSYKGIKVFGYDLDSNKMTALKGGKIPFHEPHLEELLAKNINKNFFVCSSIEEAIKSSEIIFFCVGTSSKETGSTDLAFLFNSIREVIGLISKKDFKTFVIKSTVPPSTTKEKIKPFIETLGFHVGQDIGLADNPEFLREGHAWEDSINPDRIVVGIEDEKTGNILENIFTPFRAPIFKVSWNTAEFIKYLSNTILATLISYSNEMSIIANLTGGIDISRSFKILHLDKRWSGDPANITTYAYPGCGFGGSCLPKDTQALLAHASSRGYEAPLLKSVLSINDIIKDHVVDVIARSVKKTELLGILGLSFKPQTDDIRETPAKYIIQRLIGRGYRKLIAYDPLAVELFKKEYGFAIEYSDSLKGIIEKTNHFILLTAWEEFKENKEAFLGKKIFDFRYLL